MRTLLVTLLAAALLAAGCGSAAASPSASTGASLPVSGNGVVVALPSDAPSAVRARSAVASCGAEVLFEADVDMSPVPTAPGPVTGPAANEQGLDCLLAAWQAGSAAELTTSETSDEGDEIYTIYRLPGDGTVLMMDRLWSHSDRTVAWTEAVCRQIGEQSGRVTPSDCQSETPIP